MKDILTKATFGFFMAQLFPGSVIVFSIAFVYAVSQGSAPNSILATADRVLTLWNSDSVPQQLFLLALCIGAGMFVHGIHWTLLGYLENKNKSIFNSYDCTLPFWLQVVIAPVKLILDTVELFLLARHIKSITLTENAPNVG